MSTRYNTGNPIESTDVRDMSDNAKNFDEFVNSASDEFTDRLGIERKTIHGMNSEFDSQILNMGFTRVGTFAAGATLTNPRQTLLWDIADGGDGQEYGWSGAFPKVAPPLSTPNTTGGIAVGKWMSRFDPELRVQVREALRRSYAEAGYNVVGTFQAGFTYVNANDVGIDLATGKGFTGSAGPIAAGTDPASGGFVDRSGSLLRSDLLASPLVQTEFSLGVRNAPATSEYAAQPDTTLAFKQAMATAKTRGKILTSDLELLVDGAQIKGTYAPTNVILEGDAELTGCSRKFAAKKYLPEFQPKNTIDPQRHLSNLSLTNSPVVAIIGDSISTLRVNASSNDDSMWGMITAKLQKENPKKTFQFYNRAIGGKTFASTVLPVNGEPWSVGGTKKWYEYVVELNPDLVFIAFGMNDSANLNWNAFTECVNAIAATNTEIIFVTTPVPSKAAVFTGESNEWNTDAGQEGRDHAACVVRTYAQHKGYGLIDVNRTMVACRDGFDVATAPLKQITSGASGFYEIPDKVIDSSFRFTISGSDWPTIEANAADQPSYLYGGNYADVVIFENNNNTGITLKAFQTRNSSVGSYLSKAFPIVVPGSTHYFDVSCIDNVVSIYHSTISFNNMTLLMRFSALRGIGYGRARVGSYDTGGHLQNIEAAGGVRHAQYRQTITDTEIWGQSTTNANTQPEYGGNGVNHYSSKGLAKIVKKTLDAVSFHAPLFERWPASNQSGGVFSRLDDRTLLCRGIAQLTSVPIDTPFGQLFMSDIIALPNFPQSLFKANPAGGGIDGSVNLTAIGGGQGIWVGDVSYDNVGGRYLYRLYSPVIYAGVNAKVNYTAVGEINPIYAKVKI